MPIEKFEPPVFREEWWEVVGNVGAAGIFGVFVVIYMLFLFAMLAFCVVSYVLQSIGLHSIAKRRGIHHSWLAWIPVGNLWLLGSVSDQYQYVVKGKIKNRRKALLWMYIVLVAAYLAVVALAVAAGISGRKNGLDAADVGVFVGLIACALAFFVLAILVTVFHYLACYDLFASCNPNNAVMFLVLSIVFQITLPVFIFVCRKKDAGMPPRKQANVPAESVLAEAVEEVEEPVEESAEEVLEEGFANPEEFEEEA